MWPEWPKALQGASGTIPSSGRLTITCCSAEGVVAADAVAERAIERGVPPDRIVPGGGFVAPEDVFTPDGPRLNIPAPLTTARLIPNSVILCGALSPSDGPYFGVYG